MQTSSTPSSLRLCFALILSLFLLHHCPAQTLPQPAVPVPTLRAQAHLVVVDVVVLTKTGTPVHGLKQADFILTEDGSPQTIKVFQENASASPAPYIPPAPLPPGFFSNLAPRPSSSAVDLILLDTLNTPVQDQNFVRLQLLDFVQHQRPGTSIAIFALGSRLRMLQGFTSDPAILKAALDHQSARPAPLLGNPIGGGGNSSGPDSVLGLAPAANTSAPSPSAAALALALAGLKMLDQQQKVAQVADRVTTTLQAINQLARSLASIPGRKNLIWFSGSFPLSLIPAGSDDSMRSSDPFASVNSLESQYRETTNLLARSQVAVYPIDARGIRVSPVFEVANQHPNFRQDDNQFLTENAQEHATMERMAQDTGGAAFVNTNGLSEAVAKAVTLGSNYYTFAYSPSNPVWKGDFRKIRVQLQARGYKLSYRRGYFADDPNSSKSAVLAATSSDKQPIATPMQIAMEYGVPAPTEIIFKVRVAPVSGNVEGTVADRNKPSLTRGPYRRFAVDFLVDPAGFRYPEIGGPRRLLAAEFLALLYTPDGVLINSVIDSDRATLTTAAFAALQHTSIPSHQEISVPVKGEFTLRLGVGDLSSGRIGVTEVPISAVRNLPPLQVPAAQPLPLKSPP